MELIIFQILILLFSVVIHEVSHGVVADKLGDPTARLAGRLTLNPIKHLDPFGSVILPLLLSLIPGGVIFGWAKPVPYDPRNLKNPEQSAAIIAAAGPLSNFLIAAIFSIPLRLGLFQGGEVISIGPILFQMIVIINIVLGVFNLIPIPPLDGSKVLFALLPRSLDHFKIMLERYGMFILLAIIFMGLSFLNPVIEILFKLFTGMG